MTGRKTELGPLLLGLGVVVAYWIVLPGGQWLQGQLPLLSTLRWNWLGKLLVIGAALVYFQKSQLTRDDVGMTLRQRAGSILPAIIGITLMCAFSAVDEMLLADGPSLATERLFFQAIMPGLDEELVYRGLLLAFFSQAFAPDRSIKGRASMSAGIAVTFLFAAGHGLFIMNDTLIVNWRALFVTGTLGAGLLWLRTRTGSLVAPTLAHNLVNFSASFF